MARQTQSILIGILKLGSPHLLDHARLQEHFIKSKQRTLDRIEEKSVR